MGLRAREHQVGGEVGAVRDQPLHVLLEAAQAHGKYRVTNFELHGSPEELCQELLICSAIAQLRVEEQGWAWPRPTSAGRGLMTKVNQPLQDGVQQLLVRVVEVEGAPGPQYTRSCRHLNPPQLGWYLGLGSAPPGMP